VADKKSEDAGHTKVPGKHHVTHTDGNPPDELVWAREAHKVHKITNHSALCRINIKFSENLSYQNFSVILITCTIASMSIATWENLLGRTR
jgi:hypothetical protein